MTTMSSDYEAAIYSAIGYTGKLDRLRILGRNRSFNRV